MIRWQVSARQADKQTAAKYWVAVFAIFLTLGVGALLLLTVGTSPLAVYKVFFIDPFSSAYILSEIANKTVTLAIIALPLAIGFRANIWNIGAEGQLLMGAIFASFTAIMLIDYEGSWVLWLVLLSGMVGGMAWALIPAALRVYIGVNEILTSLMLVYVAQLSLSYVVHGPLKDPEGFNFPQSPLFSDSALLPSLLENERLFVSILLLPIIVWLTHIFIYRSWVGFQMRVIGLATDAGRYSGFSLTTPVWLSFILTGLMAGLMGAVEVTGAIGQLTPVISPGYGFTAIIVAFLGRLNPIGIVGAAWLLAMIQIGGENGQIDLALPVSVSGVFQGLILFSLLAVDFFVYYQVRITTTLTHLGK